MDDSTQDRLADVRANIQRHRKERELSQAELAELVSLEGVKFFPQTIQKIENGGRTIRLDEAMAIAKALNVSMGDLMRPVDSPVVELERAYRMAVRAREQGQDGIQDWLEGLAGLRKEMSLIGAGEPDIPEDDSNAWLWLVQESRRLLEESVQDLLRGAMRQMREDQKRHAKEFEEEDREQLRRLIGGNGGIDPEAS